MKNWKPHPHHVARDKDLSANAYRVWAVIRSHEGKDGKTELSLETICEGANLNRRTVQRAKRELRGLGYLKVHYRPGEKGKGACQYSTKTERTMGCQNCTSKETYMHQSIPSPKWEEAMLRKHDCNGCGWCAQCRKERETELEERKRDSGN